jgi:hypothetical protein
MKSRMTVKKNAALTFLLVAAITAGMADAQSAPGAWTDSKTGLMWTLKDNGSDVTQAQAMSYCGTLNLGGFKDWRLPEIDELAALYDPSVTQRPAGKDYDVHVKGGIQVSGCCGWTTTAGTKEGSIWAFYFGRGLRHADDAGFLRVALCVRRAAGA